jgi:hypothetical protein
MVGKRDVSVYLNGGVGNYTTFNNITYFIDWEKLLENNTDYYLTFSFGSNSYTLTNSTCVGLLTTNLMLGSVYEATSTQNAKTSDVLGVIYSQVGGTTATNNNLVAEQNTNGTRYLIGRPRLNEFYIRIMELDGTTLSSVIDQNYGLILHFTPVDKKEDEY